MRALIGIDIGGSKICVCERTGHNTRFTRSDTGIETNGEALDRHIDVALRELPAIPAGIGIAVPGLVQDGRVVFSDVLPRIAGWVPAASRNASCPVVVVNDAEAALAETTANMAAGTTAAVVIVGTAIGAALMLDGRIFRGARGWSGELGSLPISVEGEIVPLDAIAGGAALLEALGGDAALAHERLASGSRQERAAVTRAGDALGLGLAALINLLNPDRLVLGGGTLRFPGYAEAAVQAAKRLALPPLAEVCTIEIAADAETLVARGAARCAGTMMAHDFGLRPYDFHRG